MSRRRSLANRQLSGLAGLGILLLAPLFCCGALLSLFRAGDDQIRERKPLPLVNARPDRQFDDRRAVAVEPVPTKPVPTKSAFDPAAPELPVEPRPIVYAPREWKDSTGKFSRVATFISLVDGTVTLGKAEGGQAVLPLDKLSAADQQYARVAAEPLADPTAAIIIGKVVGVADGDTLTVLDGTSQMKIRLEGIDAPESGQDFGSRAKTILSTFTFGKFVRVEWKSKDKYGRTLGHVYAAGKHVNLELVDRGVAWHYKEYNSDPVFAAAETRAREAKRGIWSIANPTTPWGFRHGQTNAPVTAGVVPSRLKGSPLSEPAHDTVIVYVTNTGEKYHRDGCQHLRRSKIPISLEDARRSYGACKTCNPPR